MEDARVSGNSLKRPGIIEALRLLKRREASALAVAELDRLSRSTQDFAATLDLPQKQGWAVVCLDLGVETITPAGRLVTSIMAAVASWEREVIGERTRDGLAERKAAGVKLGRERMTNSETWNRIIAAAMGGETPTAIARALNADAVATPNGARTLNRADRAHRGC